MDDKSKKKFNKNYIDEEIPLFASLWYETSFGSIALDKAILTSTFRNSIQLIPFQLCADTR